MSEEHKRLWRERQQQSVPVLVVTRDGQRGQQMRTPDPIEPEWPDEMPPFLYAREHPADRPRPIQFAPDGALWVERTTPAGEGRLHDVIDRRGAVVRQVRLPKSRRLVGFGNGTIYLVRIDEFDLEYLERYAMPG